VPRIAGLAIAVSAAACLALPAGAGAQPQNPLPSCVQTVIANAPGFITYTVSQAEQGELPRIMGPFLPC
jgi:hypothetical protein